jgi:ABC-2 type transport system ATP-binding protein
LTAAGQSGAVVEVKDLALSYRGGGGLGGVSFSMGAGSVTGFLGRNGAGKSTTMRVLAGALLPDAGTVRIGGHRAGSEAARRAVGHAPEEPPLSPSLTVLEHLRFAAALRGADSSTAALGALLDEVDLGAHRHRLAGVLSRGMRQRLGTALALVGEPQVLLLDEPTAGLDPAQVELLHGVLARRRALGTAILWSTHVTAELVGRIDCVVAIAAGRVVFTGPGTALDDAVAVLWPRAPTASPVLAASPASPAAEVGA